ncbi:NADase-type glycan-binding domain-containing protein [Myxococcus sp. Y35]|uniref:NADase-type glycan-binding domain-containing protein n=1 Tax=Pseudomyxococcus flavus TaxID=3115648 RepID=UPI003CF6C628
MILLSLLLAATPPVLLEPDAGSAHRLHPRRVTASSFLENGWNKHAQNYLPLYVADDDPATAWVEGAKGRGEGQALEWWGPELSRAKTYRLFLRNGFQKSAKLFRANARPRKVKLEPLVQGETGPQVTGTALETELKDVLGWQEVRLPVPNKVQGVRLTLVSTYPGTSYDDTCLSDLRVYVEGEDPYKPEAEAAAFEQVRSFALERKQAAARSDSQAKVEWAPRYEVETLLSRNRSDEEGERPRGMTFAVGQFATVPEKDSYKAALARAKKAAELFDRANLDYEGQDSEARAKWTRVKPAQLRSQAASARAALSAMEDDSLVRIAGLLHLGDASFFEADASQAKMLADIEKLSKQEAQAAKVCVSQCEKRRKAAGKPERSYDCPCAAECLGCYEPLHPASEKLTHQLTGGEFLLGSLARPTAFLRGKSELSGSREAWYSFRQTLVTYTGDKADVVLTYDHSEMYLEDGSPLRVHVLDWREANGKASLAAITTFIVNENMVRVLRYRPATRA